MSDLKSKTLIAQFAVGELVHHNLFNYRGVVIDVDPQFLLTDEWYDNVATSRPPKDLPWYHVLVHGSVHQTYVSERNLSADQSAEPIVHPQLDEYFNSFQNGRYHCDRPMN